MNGQPLYGVYNRDCGHVLGVHADRRAWEPTVARMQARENWSLRTRRATDEDMLAVVRGVKCERCDGARADGGGQDGGVS